MIFPTGGPLPRHPSQLYEFFLEGLVLLIILNIFIRKPRPAGAASGLFLFGYGSFRFIVEYFREPDAHLGGLFGGWISMGGQILSLPMVIGGLLLMLWAYKIQTRNKPRLIEMVFDQGSTSGCCLFCILIILGAIVPYRYSLDMNGREDETIFRSVSADR